VRHLALTLSIAAPLAAQAVPHPADHLGHEVGEDFKLVDWDQTSSYYQALAAASPRVTLERLGSTTQGRSFLLSVLGSESNLARLDAIQRDAARVADPRGLSAAERERILGTLPAMLFVSNGMHSTETAATQFGMEFAYEFATSEAEPWKSAREDVLLIMTPNTNPDGLDIVTHWYRRNLGTPYEGAGTTELYQHYSGHDNNRDWFMLSQVETRLVTEQIYSVWHPHVYWDVHQQGSSGERFFVPPFRDPLNPNLDAGVVTAIDALGSRALFDMTSEGLTGISTGVSYDMWWNGGNRSVPVRHNIVGLLTEAASVNLASPIFLRPSELRAPGGLDSYAPSNLFPEPWPGGWWRIRDIIDYELAFARSLVGSMARDRRVWIENAISAAERTLAAAEEDVPRAWVLPVEGNHDVGALQRLCDTLLLSGVELFIAQEGFEADGRSWSAGSILIPRAQPYGQHVKDLFEVQRFPEGASPYDVAGWTLPFLLGVRRVELVEAPVVARAPVFVAAEAIAGYERPAQAGRYDSRDSRSWTRALRDLAAGQSIELDLGSDSHGDLVHSSPASTGDAHLSEVPRIGVYAPWTGSMDEGWLRWVLDTFELPYVTVRNEMLRAGALSDFLDVLVIPSVSGRQLDSGRAPGSVEPDFARGLEPEGAIAVEEFVRGGGRLVTTGSSSGWAIELFELPLEDVTRGPDASEFSCPGSVLRALPSDARLCYGLPSSVAIFFSRSAAWSLTPPDKDEEGRKDERQLDVLLRYAPQRTLLSGWIREPELIADRAAWVRAQHGEGTLHLFGFRPQYRSWSQAAFHMLFRAILFGDV